MCGIIAAIAQRDITKILLEGLRRLEYRGYDSAGLAVINKKKGLQLLRKVGKVDTLVKLAEKHLIYGNIGIAHTRWATHGEPTEINSHPHISGHILVVHNGIIENHDFLRNLLQEHGYNFVSDTDTEVIAHMINWEQCQQKQSLINIVSKVVKQLNGVYSIVVMDSQAPNMLVATNIGSPLIIGCGINENFLASDQRALLFITNRFIFLENGDITEITNRNIKVLDNNGQNVTRLLVKSKTYSDYYNNSKGDYSHYMRKEIFEQPKTIKNTLENCFDYKKNNLNKLKYKFFDELLSNVRHIQIVACGTSYHSAMVFRYWFEELVRLPCNVEIASEFRYRTPVTYSNSLLITLSQSGETADTLAALRLAKSVNYLGSLAICNVDNASLVRESDFTLITHAGLEISVASTKSFTAQLTILLMLVARIGLLHSMNKTTVEYIINSLQKLPDRIRHMFTLEKSIKVLAEDFFNKHHVLFLGRGAFYPIAMEGALKLKEISYIHAEAYAAGELKHGPLALINTDMPVIVIAPNNNLLKKLKSNIEEIRARGGKLYVFTEDNVDFINNKTIKIIKLPYIEQIVAPIFYSIPLQLFAYHVALLKGTDIDTPRNLAKSVTVE